MLIDEAMLNRNECQVFSLCSANKHLRWPISAMVAAAVQLLAMIDSTFKYCFWAWF